MKAAETADVYTVKDVKLSTPRKEIWLKSVCNWSSVGSCVQREERDPMTWLIKLSFMGLILVPCFLSYPLSHRVCLKYLRFRLRLSLSVISQIGIQLILEKDKYL